MVVSTVCIIICCLVVVLIYELINARVSDNYICIGF